MGFTGMALTNGDWGERMDAWAAKTISEWPLAELSGQEVVERFGHELTRLVGAVRRIPRADRRLSWAIAGFGPPGPFVARITNFEAIDGEESPEAMDRFQIFWSLRNHKPMYKLDLLFMGATSAIRDVLVSTIQRARKHLDRRRPKSVLDALVQIVRKAADDPRSGGLIGRSCLGTFVNRAGEVTCIDYGLSGSKLMSAPHQVGPSLSVIGLTLDRSSRNTLVLKGRFKFGSAQSL